MLQEPGRTNFGDRRRHPRVPFAGEAVWAASGRKGRCQVVDLSSGGAALLVPARSAAHLAGRMRLRIEIAPGVEWRVPLGTRVVRRLPTPEGRCLVGLEFPPDRWCR